jgi:mannose-6-phosphate isomerase-like protein (cupin superfamily)
VRPAIVHGPDIRPERTASGAAVRTVLDTAGTGGRLVRRLVDVPPGASHAGTTGPAGELWFLISGTGRLDVDGRTGEVGRYQGIWLPPGVSYRLQAAEPEAVGLDVVELPAAAGSDDADSARPVVVSNLADCAVEMTGDRRFRVLFGPDRGCAQATQFLGEIPPGRAPAHQHAYDEVVLVLAGEGIVHTGDADRRLAPGTCVHLPPGQQHCLENTGPATLTVLGVFHPGGSPAAKTAVATG